MLGFLVAILIGLVFLGAVAQCLGFLVGFAWAGWQSAPHRRDEDQAQRR